MLQPNTANPNEYKCHDLWLITCLELINIWPLRECVIKDKYYCIYDKAVYEEALLHYQRSIMRKVGIAFARVNKRKKEFKAQAVK